MSVLRVEPSGMEIHEPLQGVVIEALESGAYTERDVRENVDTAIMRWRTYVEEQDQDEAHERP